MLHVTNGDSVSLRESGVEGDVLVWADPLHEGPVPDAAGLDELTVVRAEYIAARFGLPAPDVLRLAPPLIITAAQLDGFVRALPKIISEAGAAK